jgi:hypothetical protein
MMQSSDMGRHLIILGREAFSASKSPYMIGCCCLTGVTIMVQAEYDASTHKDWLGLAAELAAQGINVKWSNGRPEFSPPLTIGPFDPVTCKVVVSQPKS